MIPDQFQLELQALLKKYGKEIRVSIQPMIVDVRPTETITGTSIEEVAKTLKVRKNKK